VWRAGYSEIYRAVIRDW